MKTPAVRAASALLATVALVAAGMMAPASAAGSTARLTGVVSLDGRPVPFAKVQLFRLVYDTTTEEREVSSRLKTDNTDRKGRYDFSGLSATSSSGTYAVLVTDRSSAGVKTYRTVVVKTGRTLTRNVRLAAAATVTGSVNTSDGRSPAGLTITLDSNRDDLLPGSYDKLKPVFDTAVRADGTFRLAGVPATGYDAVQLMDGRHAVQCYDLVSSSLGSCESIPFQQKKITLRPGETRVLPTVTKTTFAPPVTKVAGTVTDTSGRPLKGIEVSVLGDSVRETVLTRSSGRYSLRGSIPAGQYTVRYDDPRRVWASQYLGGDTDLTVRRQVVVTPGQPAAGLNTRLKSATKNRVSFRSGKGFIEVTFSLVRRVSGGRPSGSMTITSAGSSATARVKNGKVTVRLTGLPGSRHAVTAVYSGTSNTAGFTRGFSPR
ncbi:carboxypeptidase regulatory-like domain-containing protein [Aeromicrobium sp. CFBP 8757]|uniref:carboxypeptidase regulatory-like domain-containing protein n=1 Tax=Aeromicrobium sp. CFBP 8757 TaxID=2775288 RepID=UPI00177E7FF4|nr:carboxypeptidase regulatory-like domain-containing protein [Aeromicrobium sp. CFBP 8757]MBD8605848.1 carboxypeptidase regulatory-like domain-containing protein [Aeromicrobium sp. CFBP 8757]